VSVILERFKNAGVRKIRLSAKRAEELPRTLRIACSGHSTRGLHGLIPNQPQGEAVLPGRTADESPDQA
jgi:hypothetical protein